MFTPPPPPAPPKESVALRYKFVWRLLIVSNLALGAYMFATQKIKNMGNEVAIAKAAAKARYAPITNITTPVSNESRDLLTNVEPVKVHPSIPENQHDELFK